VSIARLLPTKIGRDLPKIGRSRKRRSEDRKIAQEKIGRSAADLQKIGRDLPKIGRSRKRAQSASMTLSSLSRAARPPLSYFPLMTTMAERILWSAGAADAERNGVYWLGARVARMSAPHII